MSLSHQLQFLKTHDTERYLSCLYLSDDIRDDVAALWAFDVEMGRVPNLVSEAMPGEIRFQWWRDLIVSDGNTDAGPLAKALLDTIRKHNLPRETFHMYLEAKTFDLYQDPMPDMNSLEGYLGETHSAMFHLAALCLGAERNSTLADACGHAGIAFGLSRLLMKASVDRHHQRVFFPKSVLEKAGLGREAWLFEEADERHQSVVAEMTSKTRQHLDEANKHISKLAKDTKPVFRTLALVPNAIKLVEQAGLDPFEAPLEHGPLIRFWKLFRY